MLDRDLLRAARLAGYGTVSIQLSLLSDHRLGEVVAAATPLGSGIGGRSAALDINGTRVFVKRIPLTDIELRPENVRSTANIFELPMFYQYGVGSAGFGAWRELAVHTMTTNWVLGDEYAGFPLMYHWRVLPDSPPEGFTDEFGGLEGAVAHWEGSPAVRGRLEAIGQSSCSLVVFLEHVPHTLAEWLSDYRNPAVSEDGDSLPFRWVEEALMRGTAFMSSRGLVHFDAHFANILTDGRQLYFADFGLALSSRFDLSADESTFLSDHLAYDHCYTASHLLQYHLLDGVRGDTEREAFLHDWIAGRRPGDIPPEISAIIDRHARPTVVVDSFFRRLLTESKQTPFPAAEIKRQLGAGATIPS
ncbi:MULTISPECIES: protein kinase family protein [Streptomyces]|uniref:Protein kinase family protein n=1 Tax=Streptomyces glycanivorans TaxID=3033808 RepID=A0ABY9JLU7_9ACTN|nr:MULTISPECIES: protein kinase family protein [unclassified Streptomyces]WLQ68677.1 protein kinase family protein [Streptomyces sp. Alt3]WSR46246.1 protein kinase family protein [Streptomyces sp. NBC_01201]